MLNTSMRGLSEHDHVESENYTVLSQKLNRTMTH